MKTKRSLKKIFLLIAALFLFTFCFFESALSIKANAETTTATNPITAESGVLDDLSCLLLDDSSLAFNADNYPAVEDDYKFQFITIAEGRSNELFVYVYQPCYEVKDLLAENIIMRTSLEDGVIYELYFLELVDSSGALFKYQVDSFSVLDQSIRIYDLLEIGRTYDEDIDGEADDGIIFNTKGVPVGAVYEVKVVDGSVTYYESKVDVIYLTNVWAGHISYSKGYFGSILFENTDSYFFVLKADRKVEDLRAVDITYSWSEMYFSQNYLTDLDGKGETKTVKTSTAYDTLTADETGSSVGDGWFGHTWTWKRIVPISKFLEENSTKLDSETKAYLSDSVYAGGWVLRFAEFPYSEYFGTSSRSKSYTDVTNIDVLRLEYITDGIRYKLGVVGDAVNPDETPDGEYDTGDGIQENISDFMSEVNKMFSDLMNDLKNIFDGIVGIIMTIVIVVGGLILLSFIPGIGSVFGLILNAIFTVIGWVFKGIFFVVKWVFKIVFWVIAFPFNLIGKLFKRKKKDKKKDK